MNIGSIWMDNISLTVDEHLYIIADHGEAFTTEVYEILSEYTFYAGRPPALNRMDTTSIFCYRNGCIFTFKAKIKDIYMHFGVPMACFSIVPDTLQKQRRLYNRIETKLPVSMSVITNNTKNGVAEKFEFNTNTNDISVGGTRIQIPGSVDIPDSAMLKITFKKHLDISLDCAVVHSNTEQMGVKFINTSNRDKKIIARYIYKELLKA